MLLSCLNLIVISMLSSCTGEIVYNWTSLDFNWSNVEERANAIASKRFIIENNIVTGIKVYKDQVFVTVPRWRRGVPSTLNTVVEIEGKHVLKPFPSWDMQEIGNCSSLQYVQSMEIDPNTGYMWIIDTGRVDTNEKLPRNLCPAKIVILDIKSKNVIRAYEFPNSVVSRTTNFLNDIVIDYVNGHAAYAYISDASDAKIVVYDFNKDTSYFYTHSSMKPLKEEGNITINGNVLVSNVGIDGIAITYDFDYVFYCALSAYDLYRIPTSLLRKQGNIFKPEKVGRRSSQSDGLVFGERHLFFGGLNSNGVYKWQNTGSDDTGSTTFNEELLAADNTTMHWIDTFAFDDSSNLWFVANSLDDFFAMRMEFANTSYSNVNIWKIHVNEQGYLWNASTRTEFVSNLGNIIQCSFSVLFSIIGLLIMFK